MCPTRVRRNAARRPGVAFGTASIPLMPPDARSTRDQLLALAERFDAEGRPTMAEAARRAAASPARPLAGRAPVWPGRPHPRTDDADARR